MTFADTLNKIIAPITNIVATGFKVYADVSVAQSIIGINDMQKKKISYELDIAADTIKNNKQAQEDVKALNKLLNKYNNGEYLTLEEYNTIVGNGISIPYSYDGYIELISTPKQTDYLSSYSATSQEVYQESTEKQTNWKKYAGIGIAAIGILWFIKR